MPQENTQSKTTDRLATRLLADYKPENRKRKRTTSTKPKNMEGEKNKEKNENKNENKGLIPVDALNLLHTSNNTKNKLNPQQKDLAYQMIAAGYSNATIVRYIQNQYNITISNANISYMKSKHKDDIAQARAILEAKVLLAAPIASKINRLAKRQELIDSLMEQLWLTDKRGNVIKPLHDQVNKILDSVQREVEPLEINVKTDLRDRTAEQYKQVTKAGVISEAMNKLKSAGMQIAEVVPTKEGKTP